MTRLEVSESPEPNKSSHMIGKTNESMKTPTPTKAMTESKGDNGGSPCGARKRNSFISGVICVPVLTVGLLGPWIDRAFDSVPHGPFILELLKWAALPAATALALLSQGFSAKDFGFPPSDRRILGSSSILTYIAATISFWTFIPFQNLFSLLLGLTAEQNTYKDVLAHSNWALEIAIYYAMPYRQR